jgi:beta-glucosidase
MFPESFVWGCATASYQVEGAAREDGRGPSIWDTFSHSSGRVDCDHTGDVASDQYHRYPDDIRIMKDLGLKAYRMSVSWSRVLPEGEGRANEKGLAYYDRLVDALLAAGIEPYITLFHWDLPQALQDRYGGWQSRETSKRFADYAGLVVKRLSDRVTRWFTINEFSCFTDGGHAPGGWAAPGVALPRKGMNAVRHHALLAHGLGALAIRAQAVKKPMVGLAENPRACTPVYETPAHIAAARKAMGELNAPFLTAVLEGAYRESYLREQGADAPAFTAEDMKAIGTPLDFVGLNCYTPSYIRATDAAPGYEAVPMAAGHPRMDTAWLYIDPQCLYWIVRLTAELWKVPEIVISENGCAAKDKLTVESGEVLDTDRVMYLRGHLRSVARAVQEKFPLKGYFLWSLVDNFEWARGYTQRFGIVYVNYSNQARTPKMSAAYYREVIRSGVVL